VEGAILGGCGNTTGTGFNGGDCSGQVAPQANSITGGNYNRAKDVNSSIAGGCDNLTGSGTPPPFTCATSGLEAILGGFGNNAAWHGSAIGGGQANVASNEIAWVGGGNTNHATGPLAAVAGGNANTASGLESSILGGNSNTASGNCQSIPATPGSC